MGDLRRRIDDLERRAHERGNRRPVDFIIVCFDNEPREVWANYCSGLCAPGGGYRVELGEGETAEDAIAQFMPIEEADHDPFAASGTT